MELFRNYLFVNFQKLQFSLVLRVARRIWEIKRNFKGIWWVGQVFKRVRKF
jgi:hypothetical protein